MATGLPDLSFAHLQFMGHIKVTLMIVKPKTDTLATASSDLTIRIYETPPILHMPILKLPGRADHDGDARIVSMSFSPDGTQLAAVSDCGCIPCMSGPTCKFCKITVFYVPNGMVLNVLETSKDEGQPRCVAFDPSGEILAVGVRNISAIGRIILCRRNGPIDWSKACVLDNERGVLSDHTRIYRQDVESLAFASTPNTLVSTSRKALNHWDVQQSLVAGRGVLASRGPDGNGLDSRRFDDGRGPIRRVAFSPSGDRIATAQEANGADKVLVWDAATGAVERGLRLANDDVAGLGFLSDGVLVAVLARVAGPGFERGLLRAWDARTGAVVANKLLRARVVCAAVEEGAVAVCYEGGGLHVLSLRG